jgi:flagellar M-ring protein FliF
VLAVGLLLYLALVRPALKMMQPQPEKAATADGTSAGGQVEAIVGEVIDRPGLPEPVHNEPRPKSCGWPMRGDWQRRTPSPWPIS